MQDGRNGGDKTVSSIPNGFSLRAFPWPSPRAGGGGGGAHPLGSILISWLMMSRNESGWSQGGGTMFARLCFLRRIASQIGRLLRWGGRRVGVEPCEGG